MKRIAFAIAAAVIAVTASAGPAEARRDTTWPTVSVNN